MPTRLQDTRIIHSSEDKHLAEGPSALGNPSSVEILYHADSDGHNDPEINSDGDTNTLIKSISNTYGEALLLEAPGEEKTTCRRLRGIFAILLATSLLCINPQILYHLRANMKAPYSNSNILLWMYFIYTIINGLAVPFEMYLDADEIIKPLKQPRLLGLLVLRGIGGAFVLFLQWKAIGYFMKPAPVAVINAITPMAVYVNAFFVLGEKFGIVPVVNSILAIVGVCIMNLPALRDSTSNDAKNDLIGTGIALGAMYVLACVIVLIRLLRDVHSTLVNLAFGIFGVIVQGTLSFSTGTLSVLHEPAILGLCFCMATISTISNFLFNYSLKHEQAGIVSLVRTTEVIFSFLFQYWFFGIEVELETALGALIIILGVVCVAFRKIVMESEETSKLRKYFYFLLY